MSKIKRVFGGGGATGAARAAAAAAAEARARAEEERRQEEARQARIRAGQSAINSNFAQFNDSFFDGIKDSYLQFASPQLDEQFQKAREQLIFALAGSGNVESTVANDRLEDLRKADADARLQIENQGAAHADARRAAVNNSRSALVSEINATADPGLTSQSLSFRLPELQAAPSFSPVGSFFQNITAGLAAGQEAKRDQQATQRLEDAIASFTSPLGNTPTRTVN